MATPAPYQKYSFGLWGDSTPPSPLMTQALQDRLDEEKRKRDAVRDAWDKEVSARNAMEHIDLGSVFGGGLDNFLSAAKNAYFPEPEARVETEREKWEREHTGGDWGDYYKTFDPTRMEMTPTVIPGIAIPRQKDKPLYFPDETLETEQINKLMGQNVVDVLNTGVGIASDKGYLGNFIDTRQGNEAAQLAGGLTGYGLRKGVEKTKGTRLGEGLDVANKLYTGLSGMTIDPRTYNPSKFLNRTWVLEMLPQFRESVEKGDIAGALLAGGGLGLYGYHGLGGKAATPETSARASLGVPFDTGDVNDLVERIGPEDVNIQRGRRALGRTPDSVEAAQIARMDSNDLFNLAEREAPENQLEPSPTNLANFPELGSDVQRMLEPAGDALMPGSSQQAAANFLRNIKAENANRNLESMAKDPYIGEELKRIVEEAGDSPSFLGSGYFHDVFDLGNDTVLRVNSQPLRGQEHLPFPKSELINQPISRKLVGNKLLEVLPKVDKSKGRAPTEMELLQAEMQLADEGHGLIDPRGSGGGNVWMMNDKPVVLDPGAVAPLDLVNTREALQGEKIPQDRVIAQGHIQGRGLPPLSANLESLLPDNHPYFDDTLSTRERHAAGWRTIKEIRDETQKKLSAEVAKVELGVPDEDFGEVGVGGLSKEKKDEGKGYPSNADEVIADLEKHGEKATTELQGKRGTLLSALSEEYDPFKTLKEAGHEPFKGEGVSGEAVPLESKPFEPFKDVPLTAAQKRSMRGEAAPVKVDELFDPETGEVISEKPPQVQKRGKQKPPPGIPEQDLADLVEEKQTLQPHRVRLSNNEVVKGLGVSPEDAVRRINDKLDELGYTGVRAQEAERILSPLERAAEGEPGFEKSLKTIKGATEKVEGEVTKETGKKAREEARTAADLVKQIQTLEKAQGKEESVTQYKKRQEEIRSLREQYRLVDRIEKAQAKEEIESRRVNLKKEAAAQQPSFLDNPIVKLFNSVKSLAYGGDVGHLLRQGKQMNIDLLFSKHAGKVLEQFPVMAKGMVSEDFFNKFHEKLYEDPDIRVATDQLGLDMPGVGKEHLKEEAFHGGALENAPIIGKYYAKPSERIYTIGLNFLRAAEVKKDFGALRKQGLTPETNPAEFKGIVRAINIIGQRGEFKTSTAKVLADASFAFGAPRAKAARIQNLVELFRGGTSGTKVRVTAAKMLAFNLGMMTLLKAARPNGEIVTDDRRSDFGKFRDGNITLDPYAGLGTTARTALAIKNGEKVSPYSKKEYGVSPASAVTQELANMVAPGVRAAWILLTGKDLGSTLTRGYSAAYETSRVEALKAVLPMTPGQIEELLQKEDGPEKIIYAAMALAGEGVDRFNYKEAQQEQKELKAARQGKKTSQPKPSNFSGQVNNPYAGGELSY